MKRRRSLLVVESDSENRAWLVRTARRLGYAARAATSAEQALLALRSEPPDLVSLALAPPESEGLATLRALLELAPAARVVILSSGAPARIVVEFLRAGAVDFLCKPTDPETLGAALRRALPESAARGSPVGTRPRSGGDPPAPTRLRGDSPAMRRVREVIRRVADTDITVLIRGESGTGKELAAQEIYERSPRRRGPFVKVNCAALPSELLESELFGYERGAFTGAERRKLGKFEIASSGTIFLDEISEMHPGLQAKLLQVLQDGEFSRLGGEGDVRVDARVIAATNRDLEAFVRSGRFREDLFYRLNVVNLVLPPLRERPEEIPRLARHFLAHYAQAYGKDAPPFSAELERALASYRWPGNVRELENLIKRIVVLGSERVVLDEIRERESRPLSACAGAPTQSELERFMSGEVDRVSLKRIGRDAARAAERRLIEKVLHRTRWNRKQAAQILQISYKALLYKMRDAGLADRV